MKKFTHLLIVLCTICSNMQAQKIVHDKAKEYQWRAMESGKIKFTPKLYYMLFHNSYRKHAENMLPLRTQAAATAVVQNKYASDEQTALSNQAAEELKKIADCQIDAAYLLYKNDFDKLRSSILDDLSTYMSLAGTSQLTTYNNMYNSYNLIVQNINTVHSSYMENSYKQELYMKFKDQFLTLQTRIGAMMKLAYTKNILK